MRCATDEERRTAIRQAKVGLAWLAPGATPKGRTQRAFEDAGYVYVFESEIWKGCVLLLSEPTSASNIDRKGVRIRHDLVQPQEKAFRSVFSRHLCLLRSGRKIWSAQGCHVVEPLLDIEEPGQFHVIEIKRRVARILRVEPQGVSCLERIGGNELKWDMNPSVLASYAGHQPSVLLGFNIRTPQVVRTGGW